MDFDRLVGYLRHQNDSLFVQGVRKASDEELSQQDYLLLQLAAGHGCASGVRILLSRCPPTEDAMLFAVSLSASLPLNFKPLEILVSWSLKNTNWGVVEYLYINHPNRISRIRHLLPKTEWAELVVRAQKEYNLEFLVEETEYKKITLEDLLGQGAEDKLPRCVALAERAVRQNAYNTFCALSHWFQETAGEDYPEMYHHLWLKPVVRAALEEHHKTSEAVLRRTNAKTMVEMCLPELNTPEGFDRWIRGLYNQGATVWNTVVQRIHPQMVTVERFAPYPRLCAAYLTNTPYLKSSNPQLYNALLECAPEKFQMSVYQPVDDNFRLMGDVPSE